MKSEWRVTSNTINGKKMYAVYRLRDINAVDHSGNREFAGSYIDNMAAAEVIAKELNKQEEKSEQ